MTDQTQYLSNDDKIVSINDRKNSMVSIVGKPEKGDEKLASVVDLGDIDRSRTAGVDAAYRYLNGQPGQFNVTASEPVSGTKLVLWAFAIFAAGCVATFFATSI